MPRRILGDEVPSDDDASLRGAHANHPLAPREASFPGGEVYNLLEYIHDHSLEGSFSV